MCHVADVLAPATNYRVLLCGRVRASSSALAQGRGLYTLSAVRRGSGPLPLLTPPSGAGALEKVPQPFSRTLVCLLSFWSMRLILLSPYGIYLFPSWLGLSSLSSRHLSGGPAPLFFTYTLTLLRNLGYFLAPVQHSPCALP